MKGKDLLNTSSTILEYDESEFIDYQYGSFDSNKFQKTDDYTGFLEPKKNEDSPHENEFEDEKKNIQIEFESYFNKLNIELSNIKSDISQLKQIPAQQQIEQQKLDDEIIESVKKLHYYADIFEHSTTQLETKVLSLALKLAQKIVQIEVSQNSTEIAEASIKKMISKVSNATKISIHLNPKDYIILKSKIQNTKRIKLIEDKNVTIGGVVITSDIGNFDASIESKVEAIMDSFSILD